MKIVVLAGGLSTERDVSILSGSKVAEALRSKGHQVVLMDVFMGYEGDDFDAERLFKENYSFTDNAVIDTEAPDLDEVRKSRKNQSNVYFGDHVLELCRAADITFLGLHGGEGEDGSIQAALQLNGIKYTGSDHLGSAIAGTNSPVSSSPAPRARRSAFRSFPTESSLSPRSAPLSAMTTMCWSKNTSKVESSRSAF